VKLFPKIGGVKIPKWKMEYNESGRITNYEINRVKESFGIGLFDSPIGTKESGMGYSKFLNQGEEFKGYVFFKQSDV
jgi:hypothetical protein